MNFPKISIITPSFNQGQFIEQTIDSVLSQNYPNLEYIVVDGGSSDNTIEIIKKYEKHLSFWISEPDNGSAHAINKGLQKCTGQIFNWLNSDDFLEPEALKFIGEHFNKYPETNVLCGKCRVFYNETNNTSHIYRMGVKPTVAETILNVEMCQPSSFYNLAIVKKLGGLNETLHFVYDDELWFRFLCKYDMPKLYFTDQQFTQFRLHSNSKSMFDGFDKFNSEIQAIFYEIARQIEAPDFILKAIDKESPMKYYETGLWNHEKLEKEIFLSYFCNKYQYGFYKDFRYKEAEECVKYLLKFKITKDLKFWKLYMKLFVLNRQILNFFRTVQ
jgi:glycosyltransferase involved in cell wall biosynthesis